MIPDPTHAYIQQLQRQLDEMKAFLADKFPDYDPSRVDVGVRGSVIASEPDDDSFDGSITPNTIYGANIREWASTAKPNPPIYWLEFGQSRDVTGRAADEEGNINPATGKPFVWYHLDDDNFVREDVVTFKPRGMSDSQSIIPINAALWPAPVTGFKVTNTHHNERDHDGIDLVCPLGTPVRVGPNGGYVAKTFKCPHCKLTGDGVTSLRDASKGYGYGSHVVIRYAYDFLPQGVKAVIPQGAYLYAMNAHLSAIAVMQGQTLNPYTVIGEVGATGNTYGAEPFHLHYALHWSLESNADFYSIRANTIDPTLLIKA